MGLIAHGGATELVEVLHADLNKPVSVLVASFAEEYDCCVKNC